MTYRERLLEKCKIVERILRNKSQLIYQREKDRGKCVSGPFSIRSYETGYREAHSQLHPILAALLDEMERLYATVGVVTQTEIGTKFSELDLMELNAILKVHATAMEKLCEGER